ncbi:MAG: S8 family serine peptidase [Oligoflexia bacterium]|nr:S8 family serine peptidase [Oligoflexia bacterium]
MRIFLLILLVSTFYSCSKSSSSNTSSTASTDNRSNLDPYFQYQWHLQNTGQNGGTAGEDINVLPVWDQNYRGQGVVALVVDDGMEIAHPDLQVNVSTSYSYNYVYGTNDPTRGSSTSSTASRHGTAVAGIIGAKDFNYIGVRGIAPAVTLAGVNLVAAAATDAMAADAMTRNMIYVHISNNSWGAADSSGQYTSSATVWKDAIKSGLSSGRGGKGIVYLWAGGNGANSSGEDNSNYDGYANYFGVLAICAVGNTGVKATYSESGANLWVCAPSQNSESSSSSSGIVTTDMTGESAGYNRNSTTTDLSDKNYTNKFNGTSASTPMVAGVAALILNANPNLSWRDVRIILAKSARKNDSTSSGWTTNGAGYNIHHDYGFGVVNAESAVNYAKTWTNVGTLVGGTSGVSFPTAGVMTVNQAITDNPNPESAVSSTITVSSSGISKIEYVAVTVKITHADWGNLEIKLRRSGGSYSTQSTLATKHTCYNEEDGSSDVCNLSSLSYQWTFGVTRDLGESADGDWILEVKDKKSGTSGTFDSWRLTFYGE